MTKRQKIKALNKKIETAKASAREYKNELIDGGFKMEDISEYNNRLAKVGILQMKMRFLCKTTKPEQYMNEMAVPGNINL